MGYERHRRELQAALDAITGRKVPVTSGDHGAVIEPPAGTDPLETLFAAFEVSHEIGEDGTVIVAYEDVWRAARAVELANPTHEQLAAAVRSNRMEPVAELTKYREIAGSIKPNEWGDLSADEQAAILEQRAREVAQPSSWALHLRDRGDTIAEAGTALGS